MSTAVDEIAELEAMWLRDYPHYAKDHLKILPLPDKNKPKINVGGAQLEFLDLNDPQVILHNIIEEIKAEGRLLRMVILKARREGVSTYVSGRYYWMSTTRFNRQALLITHDPESTEFIFQMHKRFLAQDPYWKPQTNYSNKKLLNFDTPEGTGLGSAIRVATAGKEDIASGTAVHYLHLSEMAKWPAHTTKAIMNSVSQCVPEHHDTEVIVESTAKGVGGYFYDMYWASKYHYEVKLDKDGNCQVIKRINEDEDKRDNEFNSVFLPWFIFKTYQSDVPEGFKRTAHEQSLVEAYGLTDRHLVWRRWCVANNCGGSEETFMQEYPSNPTEAFISSGNPVFNSQEMMRYLNNAPEPVMKYKINITNGLFTAAPKDGDFLVWEEPIPGEEYIVPGDVSEGINRNTAGKIADFSCAMVFKASTGEQVAEWHGKKDSDQFGLIMAFIGQRYNMGYVVPERNNHGNGTVNKLMSIKYPKIYVERVPEPPYKIRKRYGWLTSRANKGDIVDNMLAEFRDGTHGMKSKEFFRECLSFKQEGQEYGADVGKFDDRVMCACIGKWTMPMLKSRKYRRENRVQTSFPTVTAGPPVGAWMT